MDNEEEYMSDDSQNTEQLNEVEEGDVLDEQSHCNRITTTRYNRCWGSHAFDSELILVSGDKFRIFTSDGNKIELLTQIDVECIGVGYISRFNLFITSENTKEDESDIKGLKTYKLNRCNKLEKALKLVDVNDNK